MSIDHKPEDAPELERIRKAGGRVSMDGRVNGGLNLSRAIGDLGYKQNKELGPKEQMITAFPDVKTLTIDPETDSFMVLACDGIWNFMSSQNVVDFISKRLEEGREKLSQICEEVCRIIKEFWCWVMWLIQLIMYQKIRLIEQFNICIINILELSW